MIFTNDDDLTKMRAACRVAAIVLQKIRRQIVPGIHTKIIESFAIEEMRRLDAVSASYLYKKRSLTFPSHICVSVNSAVVHGIPTEDRVLNDGDIVSLDVAVLKDGFYGDNACTVIVGQGDEIALHLVRVTESALYLGIEKARVGNRIGDISSAIQKHVETNGFSLVREFSGHGLGKALHEDPPVPNYGRVGTGPKLVKGMTLAIEPMVNEGLHDIKILLDGWTVATQDGKRSAHFEHTVLVTDGDPEILTAL